MPNYSKWPAALSFVGNRHFAFWIYKSEDYFTLMFRYLRKTLARSSFNTIFVTNNILFFD